MPASVAPKAPAFLRPALSLLAGLGIFVAIVFLGTIATFVLMQVRDPLHPTIGLLVAQLVVNAVGALAAGLATGRMTLGRSLYTVFVLALIPSMSSVIPVLKGSSTGEPQWFLLVRPVVIFLAVLLGGALERRRAHAEPIT
ncbi:MAG: hypothetical protein ABJE10_05560 [bacterium]